MVQLELSESDQDGTRMFFFVCRVPLSSFLFSSSRFTFISRRIFGGLYGMVGLVFVNSLLQVETGDDWVLV